jgi:alpha-galactosidase/6-phospho-beta-glucosidase family protein
VKLTVIGGGSTYTPELIDGVITRYSRLPITNIHLVDIEKSKLEIVARFAQRMIKAANVDITIEYGTDLAAEMNCLVVNTILSAKRPLALVVLPKRCAQSLLHSILLV